MEPALVEEKGSLNGVNSWVLSAIGNLGSGAKKRGTLDLRTWSCGRTLQGYVDAVTARGTLKTFQTSVEQKASPGDPWDPRGGLSVRTCLRLSVPSRPHPPCQLGKSSRYCNL